MKTPSFNQFVERLRRQLACLSHRQVATVRDLAAAFAAHGLCLDLIEQHGRDHPGCPHCHGSRIHRYGYASGLQRYRCRDCRRTYNALTNTPLAHLRLRGKWLPYLECLLESKTVRGSAATVAIHRNTSFRWRHRFLTGARLKRPAQVQGIVEADETYLLESQKGSRNLDRPARHRGGVARTRGITRGCQQIPAKLSRLAPCARHAQHRHAGAVSAGGDRAATGCTSSLIDGGTPSQIIQQRRMTEPQKYLVR